MRITFVPDSRMERGGKYSNNFKIKDMGQRKILFDADSVKELARSFGCTERAVRYALNGRVSELALRIRKRAIDIGLREKGEEKVTVLN